MAVDNEFAEMPADALAEAFGRGDENDKVGLGNGVIGYLVVIGSPLVD